MKAQDVRNLIEQGEFKKALAGAKDFRLGVTKEQRSEMARAYECFVRPEFYRSIGKDPATCIESGIRVLMEVV
jgi:hypothetical protein